MRKTKEMNPGGFYLLKGESSANSSFFEDREEAMKFIRECNKRLHGFAIIHEYLLMRDGWMLVISLLDDETIKENYKKNWEASERVKESSFLNIAWQIISEQIRQVIFTYVIFSNKKNGREGSKVKKSYERFWFESVGEAEEHLGKMKRQLLKLEQSRKTYRSKKRHFRIPETEGRGAVFLCSLRVEPGQERVLFGEGCIKILPKHSDVLRSLVNLTLNLHFPTKNHISTPKIE